MNDITKKNEDIEKSEDTAKKAAAENGEAASQEEQKLSWKRELLSWVIILVVAYVMAQALTRYVIIKTEVISGSMISTLLVGDRVVANRMSYVFSDPERGDIIFFKYPDDEEEIYVKRIIGLPGETVDIIDGKVYIDGALEPLDEPYLYEEMLGSFGPYKVPEGEYFMLGDNRNVSVDSRFWDDKYVSRDQILGKAWFRYKPNLGIVHSADYD